LCHKLAVLRPHRRKWHCCLATVNCNSAHLTRHTLRTAPVTRTHGNSTETGPVACSVSGNQFTRETYATASLSQQSPRVRAVIPASPIAAAHRGGYYPGRPPVDQPFTHLVSRLTALSALTESGQNSFRTLRSSQAVTSVWSALSSRTLRRWFWSAASASGSASQPMTVKCVLRNSRSQKSRQEQGLMKSGESGRTPLGGDRAMADHPSVAYREQFAKAKSQCR
jgi:hypothetical protein